jgi:phenylacetate-coenzyme A ligase PaaK-like adenylate-forming protein
MFLWKNVEKWFSFSAHLCNDPNMNIKIIMKVFFEIRRLRRNEFLATADLEHIRYNSVKRLRNHAMALSPFYQKYHKGYENRPLNELPVMTKTLLMENFDNVVTDRRIKLADVRKYAEERNNKKNYLGRYRVNATSGSTGEPGFFLYDEPEWVSIIASFARGQDWAGAGLDLTRRRRLTTVASLSPWHMSSQLMNTASTWFTPSKPLAASDPLEKNIVALNQWQPDLLTVYASMARILAEEKLSGRLMIQPEKVFTSSEVLTDETRRRVKEAWGNEPYNQYGSTETADIAAEHHSCRKMHLFDDLLIVENVDEKNRPVPPGEYGEKILVTTLFSRTQPLIRYVVNDSVKLNDEKCPDCHLPFSVLESIQGRREDSLSMKAKKGGMVTIQPLVFNRIMDILPVSGWQIHEQKDKSLTIYLSNVRENLNPDKLSGVISNALMKEGAAKPVIRVKIVNEIPKSASGKSPLVRSFGG